MLLVIDAGNSNLTLGVFRDAELVAQWRLVTDRDKTAAQYSREISELFARSSGVRVRQRFFGDEASLDQWCRELLVLPEPAIVVIASHGVAEGLSVRGKIIDTKNVFASLRYAANLKLLHFSSCLVGLGRERAPFPVSGYATSVDWGASALLEFTYLDLILNRGMDPATAAAKLPLLVRYAGDRAPRGSPYPAAGFRFFPAAVRAEVI